MIGLGVILLAVQACSGGPEPADDPLDPGPAAEQLDCPSLITPAATDALGWAAGEPEEHGGRCLLRSDDGEITVGTRAVVASGDERAGAVQEELEAQCERLRSDGSQFVGEPAWLDGAAGCFTQVDPDTGTGVAELILVNDRDEVVQIRVAAPSRVAEAEVEAAVQEMAGAAADLCQAACA